MNIMYSCYITILLSCLVLWLGLLSVWDFEKTCICLFKNICSLSYTNLSKVNPFHCEWVSEWVSDGRSVVSDSLQPHGLPGSSVLGILLARILEWVAISFSRGSSWPRDWTEVSCIADRFFTIWATRKPTIKRHFLSLNLKSISGYMLDFIVQFSNKSQSLISLDLITEVFKF